MAQIKLFNRALRIVNPGDLVKIHPQYANSFIEAQLGDIVIGTAAERIRRGRWGMINGINSAEVSSSQYAAIAALVPSPDVSDKVDKVAGKSLSTNDLTDILKTSYDSAASHAGATHAPAGAQVNADITKEEIEAKLTGELTSHTHAGGGDLTIEQIKSDTDIASSLSLKHSNATDHASGSDNQDLSGLVAKESGKSLVADTEIAKIHAAGSDDQDLSGKANIDDPTFTTKITTPKVVLPSNGEILLTIPATNGHATGPKTDAFQSGYTSAIGDLVYLDTNSKWQKADKGTSVATYGGFLGIALEVKTANNALLVALPGSFVYTTSFPALTVGSPVYMGDAGAVTVTEPTEPDQIRIVGYGIHADKIFFNPSSSLPDVGSYEPFIADYYVATTGSDANPGTFALPFKSWQKAFATVTAGQLVYIRGGNYSSTDGWYSTLRAVRISGKHGTSGSPIRIEAYPGETPVLDGTNLATGTRFGILMDTCNYWNFKGLHVINTKDTVANYAMPWEMQSCTYMNFEGCVIHDSANGFSIQGNSDYLTFSNCDAYTNCDQHDNADYANGFSANITSGHLAFVNCRAWDNSDDGFDMYGCDGFITFDGCWAFNNGWGIYGYNGNGAGFKMGEATGDQTGATQRWIRNCLSFGNRTMGFDESDNVLYPMITEAYNNTIFDNDEVGINYQDDTTTSIFKNNIVYNNPYNYYPWGANIVLSNNSWQVATITDADFVSVDPTGSDGPRASNFALPVLNFMKLASGSDCIDAGVDVGLPFLGAAPDLGCFERQ